MAAVRRSDCQRSAGSQNRARYWCAVKGVASSSKRRTSGRTTSALAWVPGLGRSPARSNGAFGICVIRLPDATLHARHGHGQFCPPWPRTGRGALARTPPLGTLHQLNHPRRPALRRRGETITETSPSDQHVRRARGGCPVRSVRCKSLRHSRGRTGSTRRADRHVRYPHGCSCPLVAADLRHEQYPALQARRGARDRELVLTPWAAEQQAGADRLAPAAPPNPWAPEPALAPCHSQCSEQPPDVAGRGALIPESLQPSEIAPTVRSSAPLRILLSEWHYHGGAIYVHQLGQVYRQGSRLLGRPGCRCSFASSGGRCAEVV